MAATRLIPMHKEKNKSDHGSLKSRLDYSQNPEKTEGGELIRAYECDPETAAESFQIAKEEYRRITGRTYENEVIAYQIRQSFKPGEVTPEEANRIGYELAMRFTKGNHAFTVSTHVDKAHIHNHIIFNSTTLDCTRKFKNFWGSSFVLQRVSDLLCLEHKLSVITPAADEKKERRSFERRHTVRDDIRKDLEEIIKEGAQNLQELLEKLKERGYEVKKGKHLALRGKHQKRFVRLDTLGEGFTEKDLWERFPEAKEEKKDTGKRTAPPSETQEQRFGYLIDIEEKIRQGKGKGYEHWAKIYNVKQMAQVLLFLQENKIGSLEELSRKAEEAVEDVHVLSGRIREKEARMEHIQTLRTAVFDYMKSREVFAEYKARRYSEAYLEEHREEITKYREAQKTFRELGIKEFPKVKELNREYGELLGEKRELYKEYREKKERMQELLKARSNVETILEIDGKKERMER